MKIIFNILLTIILLFINQLHAQDVDFLLGQRDSIASKVLNENRHFIVHVPENYNESEISYPVMFRLDGDNYLLLETIGITNRLCYGDEAIPEIIIVSLENTNRARDMWPVNNEYYPSPEKAGAKDFLSFLEKELIPHINKNYRTNNERILCGQSLSAVFTLYAFISKPKLFNSYLAISGAFPGCEHFFVELSNNAFQNPKLFAKRQLFVTNGLKDPLDPEGVMNQQIIDFSRTLDEKLGNNIDFYYQQYENEGHVPYHSLYDGLKFIFKSSSN